MDAMTIKMDAQYKELQYCAKQPTPDLDDDDIPMSREEEAKFMQSFLIRVKQKQLNLGVGTERMIFNIDSAIKHSYSNDDTCFSIDVIDEILEEDFDALLDEGSKILHSIEGTILEEEIFSEFDKFIAMAANENYDSESDEEEPKFEKITINTDYKIKTSLEEPPTDLELKPLPDNLEYVFLEEPSFLPVIISSQLSAQNKSKLVSVLKKHKEAFAWKTTDIPATFQRCMLAIFQDMVEESVERCEDAHFIFNWEKCHFMVKEGIVLGHKVSGAGLEVDKAKIDVNSKLPPPTNIKEFDIEIKDKKGTENVAADHLSRIDNDKTSDNSEVDNNFPRETLMEITLKINTETILSFWNAKALISDRGTHFCNKIMEKAMKRYGVSHRFSTSYHPQTSGQVENTNRTLKRILKNTVKDNPAIWSRKLDDTLWAFRTAYKTPTDTTPYKLIYGKNNHMPFEIGTPRPTGRLIIVTPISSLLGKMERFSVYPIDEILF
ncbi:reverse transcriptase domain-containing protein [Tanacetum coccineum]|uniref:Reverse transcriptase domain-containing protein n=1 Tax=Tanacetum coccineum TaxID=301880 RepID=A0ABQ5I6N1_9ASTR